MLTDIQCKTAEKRAAPYKLADGQGLFLLVTTSGYRSWRMKYRFEKKEKLLTFGPYPQIGLKEVRRMAEDARRVLRAGLDPATAGKSLSANVDLSRRFETIAREWHALQSSIWSAKYAEDVLRSLEDYVFPTVGSLDIAAIRSDQVLTIVRAIEARPAVETARRVRQRISAIFSYAIADSKATSDPAAVIVGALQPLIKGRQPALLTIEEARALLIAAEDSIAHPITKLMSRFIALTAVRPGVVRFLPWTELLDLDGPAPLWHVPAERMKLIVERKQNDRFDFLVPLARQAVEVLTVARTFSAKSKVVFPSERNVNRPMSENAVGYLYNRLPAYRGRHVPHGWRSTFSTLMNGRAQDMDRPADRAIIDLMLAHLPSGVESKYNRAAYMPRRRALAQEWADVLLDGLRPASSLLEGRRR
ncbi:MAG TPA: integrase arm-type DNA-binding domain-containing protein [Sphingomonas sp.]|uniref:tyrosine-type recombinase/integrase n=1 Tax=Sphingomonas sp. TaxID=28214 RepID=UPI002EDB5A16